MNTLQQHFVLYKESLELKKLGFEGPSYKWFYRRKLNDESDDSTLGKDFCFTHSLRGKDFTTDPLFQQAFEWFREKYGIHVSITPSYNAKWWNLSSYGITKAGRKLRNRFHEETFAVDPYDFDLKSYNEAQLACLQKLIELVKTK